MTERKVQVKPKVEVAKYAGSCCHCGRPIYVGDKIRLVMFVGQQGAVHKDCWHG